MDLRETMLQRLQEAFPDAEMRLAGEGSKWELRIAAEEFRGLSRVKQHQAVYKPLRDLLDANHVHALTIQSCTPDQWQG